MECVPLGEERERWTAPRQGKLRPTATATCSTLAGTSVDEATEEGRGDCSRETVEKGFLYSKRHISLNYNVRAGLSLLFCATEVM